MGITQTAPLTFARRWTVRRIFMPDFQSMDDFQRKPYEEISF